MHPPTKDQADIGVDNPTIDASDSKTNPDRCRQEYKQEADINYMLSRFNVEQPRNAPTYGEWDDSLDLQMAIESTREAQQAYARLPEKLRERFKNMTHLVEAVDKGALVLKDGEPPPEPPKPAPVPA